MERQRGLALVTVLWGLVILAAIAAAMLSTGRVSSRLAAGGVERAKAEALAEAGVNRAVLGLMFACSPWVLPAVSTLLFPLFAQ